MLHRNPHLLGQFRFAFATCLLLSSFPLAAAEPEPTLPHETRSDIPYREEPSLSEYAQQRCRLDVHRPVGGKAHPLIVWFHGGGLIGGEKAIPAALQRQGVIVVAANYRLSPRVQAPAYIEDAAAAVAWASRHSEELGGDRRLIFVAGHSAGGYLANLVGLDQQWLKPYDINPDQLAGLIPLSGQAVTHYTIRAERGIEKTRPVIDELAPLYHVRPTAAPLLIISGDRNRELLGRYEETAYFWRMLKEAGHPRAELLELQGYDHGGMVDPGLPLLLRFVRERTKELIP